VNFTSRFSRKRIGPAMGSKKLLKKRVSQQQTSSRPTTTTTTRILELRNSRMLHGRRGIVLSAILAAVLSYCVRRYMVAKQPVVADKEKTLTHDWMSSSVSAVKYRLHAMMEDWWGNIDTSSSRIHGGYFPEGCVWRDVPSSATEEDSDTSKSRAELWKVRKYEFWDADKKVWSSSEDEIPKECTIDHVSEKVDSVTSKTEVLDYGTHKILKNVWFTQGYFYRLETESDEVESTKLSTNIDLMKLVVHDIANFSRSVDVKYVKGETALIDFSYFIHPTAIGHWLEYLLPLMSMRRLEGFLNPPQAVILMHLKRTFVFEWVRGAIAAAFGLHSNGSLPPLLFQQETASVWDQIGMRFENVSKKEWVCFEKVIVAKDVILDGPRASFKTGTDAVVFRKRMHRLYGIKTVPVSLKKDKDVKVTLLHKSANRRIRNREELKTMLSSYGTVQEYEFTEAVPMEKQLQIISKTHILVSAHTSGLANAIFLPPGAVVVEIVQRNWLTTLEKTFSKQILSLGDVDHISWKAKRDHEGPYIDPNDERKFGGPLWEDTKCNTEDCVEAHTHIDIVANITEVKAVIDKHMQSL